MGGEVKEIKGQFADVMVISELRGAYPNVPIAADVESGGYSPRRLRDVCPAFAQSDVADRSSRNTKLGSNRASAFAAFYSGPNEQNLLCTESSEIAIFAANLPWHNIPALIDHVMNVVGLGSEPEVGRINTRWIVAIWAVVANLLTWRDWAKMKFVRKPVGQHGACANSKYTIATGISARRPQPAVVVRTFVDLVPKAAFEWLVAPVVAPVANWGPAVPTDITHRLTFGYSQLRNRLRGKPRLLPTSAVAIAVWDFVRGFVRGMIGHVNSLLSAIGQAGDCCKQLPGFCIGRTPVIIACWG